MLTKKIKVAFFFHYRNLAGAGSLREKTFKKVWAYYEKNFVEQEHEDFEIIAYDFCSKKGEPYNRGASRNIAARRARELGADICIIMDADTFTQPHKLSEAILLAHHTQGLVYPFKTYRKELHYTQLPRYLSPSGWPKAGYKGLGSVYVVNPKVWQDFGGAPEEYTGWGVEDNITAYTAWAWGVPVLHLEEGVTFGIETRDTPERKTSAEYLANLPTQQLYETYWFQRGTPEEEKARKELKKLIIERRKKNV